MVMTPCFNRKRSGPVSENLILVDCQQDSVYLEVYCFYIIFYGDCSGLDNIAICFFRTTGNKGFASTSLKVIDQIPS